jgi:DNA-directed RNA polymerase subunit RPC12/RpoP
VNQSSKQNPRVALTLVAVHPYRHAVSAPPVLIVSTHTVDYTCGKCGTVLMHAEEEQVHNLLIRCTECGSYNSTDE